GRSETKDPRGGFRQGDATREPDGSAHRVATWADCPGCDRCRATGGLVLRRGSWRPTSSWEPILMLAPQSGYHGDGESVKTPAANPADDARRVRDSWARGQEHKESSISAFFAQGTQPRVPDGMANARDVLRIAAEPLRDKHYAAFPTALVEWCLRA